ncbi:hypothetical protein QF046_002729 [Microbacterium sp. W4I4]|uniref:hypothetical protein n=1 Tax=Microbacterium sp. W4I4 TaxID=3042295 RepID=UPI0027879686|nr:hypothetical protein [Microbacterium sp. W4I4]MDQ0615088.1 hypothetical protein [Microbacterium sp. W4I4]
MQKNGWLSPNIAKSDEVTQNESIPGAADYFALLKNPNLVWYENAPDFSTFSAVNTFFRQARIEMQDKQTSIDQAIEKTQKELQNQVAAAG